jgi:hypothetical protein
MQMELDRSFGDFEFARRAIALLARPLRSAVGFAAIVDEAVLVAPPAVPSFSLNDRRVTSALASASLTKASNINFLS